MEFKEEFRFHDIEILVDNATTHTAKPFSISDFRKGKGFFCPVDRLEWIDEINKSLVIETHLQNGESKGLFQICKELKLIPDNAESKNYKMNTLVELSKKHPAFDVKSFLIEKATKYNVIINYVPKFHSELSTIEGVWAHQKQYIRKNTDQSFECLRKLLVESRNNLKKHPLIPKLWRRFWRTIEAYENGVPFLNILKNYFGVKTEVKLVGHRQIQPFKSSLVEL